MEFLHQMTSYFEELGTIGLAINSFVESFFLVPPPDFVLIWLDLKTPNLALYYALICTIASILGAIVGYAIGKWFGRPAFDWIFSCFQKKGSTKGKEYFDKVERMYNKYGSWAVFFSAFTPIPYKVFTIASGILKMNFLGFILASFLGRGGRFFIVSVVLMLFGEQIKNHLELVIIVCTLIIILFFVSLFFIKKIKNAILKKRA